MPTSTIHQFGDATARIKQGKKGYFAQCDCGWRSREYLDQREAVISFEEHVLLDPQHEVEDLGVPPKPEEVSAGVRGEANINYTSLLLAFLGFLYVISPIDVVPDYLVGVGWIEDIIVGIFSVMLVKGGLKGRSPSEIISNIF